MNTFVLLIARQMRKEREGKMIYRLDGHEDGVNCLAVSSDDSVLVSGSEDNTARVWSIEDEDPGEDLQDIDDLFDEDNVAKKDADGNDTQNGENATGNGDEEKSDLSDEKEHDDKNEDETQLEDEKNHNDNMVPAESGIRNEGETRCLGVLRYGNSIKRSCSYCCQIVQI